MESDADATSADEGGLLARRPPRPPPPPPPPPDPSWPKRGAKAWESLSRTDPDAVWSFQGWAINNADKARDMMHGFISAVENASGPGHFSIIDMASDGRGEWPAWLTTFDGQPDPVFSSANFIWTCKIDALFLGLRGCVSLR